MTDRMTVQTQKDREVALWVRDRLISYHFIWTTCGQIVTRDHDGLNRVIAFNHVKSLLRRDYIEAKGHHQGLDKIVADVLRLTLAKADDPEHQGEAITLSGKLNT